MTLFGLDISNHQSSNGFDVARARAEGFEFLTHKLTEGTWRDRFFGGVADQARTHFPGRFGAYVFCRTDTSAEEEAEEAVAAAAAAGFEPCDIPLQIDYEDTTNPGDGIDLFDRVAAHRARGWHLLPIYLPRWYWHRIGAPNLCDLPVGLWNSHYVTGAGHAAALYPGDTHPGWSAFGGRDVTILQFSEQGRAAGKSPIDLNAFRGTTAELDHLFGGTAMSDEIAHKILEQELGPEHNGWQARRYHLQPDEQPRFSQTDYARETDAKLNSQLPVYGDKPNPRPVPPDKPDDQWGHILSLRAEVLQTQEMLIELGDATDEKLGKRLREIAKGRK